MIQRIIKQLIPIFLWILFSSVLTYLFIEQISFYFNILNSLVLFSIFTGSTILVNYKIHQNPTRFIGNFLVMTTLQLLAFLSYELVLILKSGSWWIILQALVICLVLIVIQSINLSKLKLESP